jgi:hypothetical protein
MLRNLVPGEQRAKKVDDEMSLSNCTVKGRTSNMSEDILDQAVGQMKANSYFTLQLDESIDVASCELILCTLGSLHKG